MTDAKSKYLKYQAALKDALENVPNSPCVRQLNDITRRYAMAWFSPVEKSQ